MTVKTPFAYQGSKIRELNKIQNIIGTNKKITEPFLGSGIIMGHLGADSGCIVNELNEHVHHVWDTLLNYPDEFYSMIRELCDEKNRFPEYYYDKRAFWNENFYQKNIKTIYSGALFYYLMCSCHAAFIRFGPSGFNTSFKLFLVNGRKYNVEERIDVMKQFSKKIKKLEKQDVFEFLDNKDNYLGQDLIYLDPPYFNSANTYGNDWTKEHFLRLCEKSREISDLHSIPVVISNYHFEGCEKLFDQIVVAESFRMAGTNVSKKIDITGIIGDI